MKYFSMGEVGNNGRYQVSTKQAAYLIPYLIFWALRGFVRLFDFI